MTTYTASRQQLTAALAEVIDWTPALAAEYGTFTAMAEAVLSHLTAHAPSQPVVSADAANYEVRVDRMERMLARAAEAGRELGAKRTDHRGELPHAVPCPPEALRRAARI